MIVRIIDLRTIPGFSPRPGFCASGGRRWFAAHALDWSDFVKHGIDDAALRATGDALGIALADWAARRAAAAKSDVPGSQSRSPAGKVA